MIANRAKWHKQCQRVYLPPSIGKLIKELELELEEDAAVEAAAEQEQSAAGAPTPGRVSRRTTSISAPDESLPCIFCNGEATRDSPLHRCATDNITDRVRKAAEITGDFDLLAKLVTSGDLHAQDATYHLSCLVKLYNRERAARCTTTAEADIMMCESMAFADLISYVLMKLTESVNYVFKMADLLRLYNERLKNLLGPNIVSVPFSHTTKMRNKILARIPELTSSREGRDTVLKHKGASFLQNVHREDHDDDAIGFGRFIKRLRQGMSDTRLSFGGSFPEDCEEQSVPPQLVGAVTMLLYGSKFAAPCGATRPALTIAQLLMTNFRETMPKGEIVRHQRHRETPFPLYSSLYVYGSTRNKAQISELHSAGIGVSHNRIMEVTSQLCRMVVRRAEEEKVLCPAQLLKYLLTVGVLDNLDFKGRSTTSAKEFHGTGISVFQLPLETDSPEPRTFETTFADVEQAGVRAVPKLPDSYALIDDSFVIEDKPSIPKFSPVIPHQGFRPQGE